MTGSCNRGSERKLPYEWTIDHVTRTITVRGYGEGVTADTLALIEQLKDQIRETAEYDFHYNSLGLHIRSSPADMMRVAQALFGEAGARFRRFAIVVPSSRVPLARIFVALAHPFGVTANVFADDEAAREWLAERRQKGHIEVRHIDEPGPAGPRHPRPTFPEAPWPDPEQ